MSQAPVKIKRAIIERVIEILRAAPAPTLPASVTDALSTFRDQSAVPVQTVLLMQRGQGLRGAARGSRHAAEELAASAAPLVTLLHDLAQDLALGAPREILIHTAAGYLLALPLTPRDFLVARLADSNLGIGLVELHDLGRRIKHYLAGEPDGTTGGTLEPGPAAPTEETE